MEKAAITRQYRKDCRLVALDSGCKAPAHGLILLLVTICPPDRRKRDDDNTLAAWKAGRDGLADALGVDDNRFRCLPNIGEPVKGGAIVVEVLPMSEVGTAAPRHYGVAP